MLNDYKTVNELVEDYETCLLVDNYLPSTSVAEATEFFTGFQLKRRLLGSPVYFSPNRKTAIVEFASRAEAHSAYRNLIGTRRISPTDRVYTPEYILL